MKLRNKKTGEIIDIYKGQILLHYNQGKKTILFKSIEELEEWEDYEEPKEYWYIDYDGGILCGESDNSSAEKMMISMGNHFESLEEAEKAVRKLKAWKRLKDKGFRFEYYDYSDRDLHNHIQIKAITNREVEDSMLCKEDLDLLFGGEE